MFYRSIPSRSSLKRRDGCTSVQALDVHWLQPGRSLCYDAFLCYASMLPAVSVACLFTSQSPLAGKSRPVFPSPIIAKPPVFFHNCRLRFFLNLVKEVQHRFEQNLSLAKQKGHQRSSQTTVPVQERVNRFELSMCQSYFYQ